MPWIVMSDGQELALQYPRVGDICIEQIAHHLAQINRFTGAAARPYSVAEHSLVVADLMRDCFGASAEAQFCALMHDAHEAITNDVATPSKSRIGAGWDLFESEFACLVAQRFDMREALVRYASEIRACDRMALYIERHQLLPAVQPNGQPCTPWPVLARVTAPSHINLRSPEREHALWSQWRDAFMDRFTLLSLQRLLERSKGATQCFA